MRETIKDKKFIVYIHRNLINGKVYVGQTCDITERWRCDGKNYFNSIKFYNAIRKYGWNNFSHEILYDNLDQEQADSLERKLIDEFNSIENGYNLKEGGARGKLSQQSLEKMSNSLIKGYIQHPERKEKIRQKAIGRVMPTKTREAISIANSRNYLIDIDGIKGSLRYWESITGISRHTLSNTLKKYGMETTIERIKYKLSTGLSWSRQTILDKKEETELV